MLPTPPALETTLNKLGFKHVEKFLKSRYGDLFIFVYAFVDSLIPIPFMITDPFLMATILAKPERWRWLVAITSLASALGGVVAYLSIYYFRDDLLALFDADTVALLSTITVTNNMDTFVLSFLGAVTPIPYMIVAWAAALAGSSLLLFFAGSIIGRLIRYGVVGWCTYRFGPQALEYAKRSLIITTVVVVILGGCYLWLKM